MNNRIAFFGKNDKEETLLVAIEFVEAEKKVDIFLFGKEHLKEDFTKKMFKDWAEKNQKVDFPEPHEKLEKSVISGDSLLPYEITSNKPETVRRAQNAWALKLLSGQLVENIKAELKLFGDKVSAAKEYASEHWAEAKQHAAGLGKHLKDKNITKANFDDLKVQLDESFATLKTQLAKRNEDLEVKSTEIVKALTAKVEEYGAKMESITKNNKVFDDLKGLHEEIKKAKITQARRKELWNKLDELFAKAKAKQKQYWNNRNDNRINGLVKAIERMEKSIAYDKKEINFQKKRMDHSGIKSLEMQLRQAKLNVAEDKIKSKEEKLAEMHKLLDSLNKKKNKYGKEEKPPVVETQPKTEKTEASQSAKKPKEDKPAEEVKSGEKAVEETKTEPVTNKNEEEDVANSEEE